MPFSNLRVYPHLKKVSAQIKNRSSLYEVQYSRTAASNALNFLWISNLCRLALGFEIAKEPHVARFELPKIEIVSPCLETGFSDLDF